MRLMDLLLVCSIVCSRSILCSFLWSDQEGPMLSDTGYGIHITAVQAVATAPCSDSIAVDKVRLFFTVAPVPKVDRIRVFIELYSPTDEIYHRAIYWVTFGSSDESTATVVEEIPLSRRVWLSMVDYKRMSAEYYIVSSSTE